ncbi:hypothetical protein ACFQH7_20630 [Microbulbifer taiwanensis]
MAAQDELASRACHLDGWSDALRCFRVAVGADDSELAVMVAPAVNDSEREPFTFLPADPGKPPAIWRRC